MAVVCEPNLTEKIRRDYLEVTVQVLKGGGVGLGEQRVSTIWGSKPGGVKYTILMKPPSLVFAVQNTSCSNNVCVHFTSPEVHVASFIGAGLHGALSNLRQSPATLGSQAAGSGGGGGGGVGQLGLAELQTGTVSNARPVT